MKIKACIKSMRLRTLPLSLSGIIIGTVFASRRCATDWTVVITLVATTILLQILSNLSNELGDTLHGTDSGDERLGMHYSIMDGEMTIGEMKRLIGIIACLCCISGLLMVLASFKTLLSPAPLLFLALGAAAIWAAMHYTLGDNPYGYKGLGDIFVFIFFGLATTAGGAYLCSHAFEALWLLPASAIGCFSVGVLNVNNIRDMKTDARTRSTVALKLGIRNARIYQTILIVSGWILMLLYTILDGGNAASFLYVLTLPLFILHLRGVWTREDRDLDPMLPLLVMSTFALALLSAAGAAI